MNRCHDPRCADGPPLDDAPTGPRLTRDGWHLCDRCAAALERRLGDLPALEDELRAILRRDGLRGQRTGSGNKPTKAGAPPSEYRHDADDALTDLRDVLTSWVFMLCADHDLRGPDLTGERRGATAARWLFVRLPALVVHDAAGDAAEEVRTLCRQAEGVARLQPGRHRLPAPCPDCGATELHRLDGEDHVLCQSCGLTWHEDDYDRLAAVLASDYLTVTEAAAAARVPTGTFRRWVSEGRLSPAVDVDGARYLRADVEKVKREERAA